jgi:hypothetical protein
MLGYGSEDAPFLLSVHSSSEFGEVLIETIVVAKPERELSSTLDWGNRRLSGKCRLMPVEEEQACGGSTAGCISCR